MLPSPVQPFELIYNSALKHLAFIQMQLLKRAEDIFFANSRNIILFQAVVLLVTGIGRDVAFRTGTAGKVCIMK